MDLSKDHKKRYMVRSVLAKVWLNLIDNLNYDGLCKLVYFNDIPWDLSFVMGMSTIGFLKK